MPQAQPPVPPAFPVINAHLDMASAGAALAMAGVPVQNAGPLINYIQAVVQGTVANVLNAVLSEVASANRRRMDEAVAIIRAMPLAGRFDGSRTDLLSLLAMPAVPDFATVPYAQAPQWGQLTYPAPALFPQYGPPVPAPAPHQVPEQYRSPASLIPPDEHAPVRQVQEA